MSPVPDSGRLLTARASLTRSPLQELPSFQPVRRSVLPMTLKVSEQPSSRAAVHVRFAGTAVGCSGSGLSAESCGRKPDPGPCRAAFPKFYYDPDTNTCQSFIYGGCRGNGNRHDSREECLNRCRSEGKGCPAQQGWGGKHGQ